MDERLRLDIIHAAADSSDWVSDGMPSFRASHLRPLENEKEAQTLLRRAEDFERVSPWSTTAWTILGAALYRNGRYQDALQRLERSSNKVQEATNEAYLSMTWAKLGNIGKAKAALERARAYSKQARPLEKQQAAPLVAEAESILSGKTP